MKNPTEVQETRVWGKAFVLYWHTSLLWVYITWLTVLQIALNYAFFPFINQEDDN